MTVDQRAPPGRKAGRRARVGQVALAILALACTTAMIWAAQLLGWWWVAAIAGFLAGLALRWRGSWLVAAAAGLLGWGLPLFPTTGWASLDGQARLISALMGAGPPVVPAVLTVGVGGALAGCGAWVGRSVRLLVRDRKRRDRDELACADREAP